MFHFSMPGIAAALCAATIVLGGTAPALEARGRSEGGPPGLQGPAADRAADRAFEATGLTRGGGGGGDEGAGSDDQPTENNPDESDITYEDHGGGQSTENNPEESDITYEDYDSGASTEDTP